MGHELCRMPYSLPMLKSFNPHVDADFAHHDDMPNHNIRLLVLQGVQHGVGYQLSRMPDIVQVFRHLNPDHESGWANSLGPVWRKWLDRPEPVP